MDTDVPANLTIVTLGVADLQRSIEFYGALGWEQRGDSAQGIVWFKTASCWLGLFGYQDLAEDIGLSAPSEQPAYRGITLGLNRNSEAEVDAAFAQVAGVGARVLKAPTRAEWGGYSGYFEDPDGHVWEIAYAPMFLVDDAGHIEIS